MYIHSTTFTITFITLLLARKTILKLSIEKQRKKGIMYFQIAVNLIGTLLYVKHVYDSLRIFAVKHIYVSVCTYAFYYCVWPYLWATSYLPVK